MQGRGSLHGPCKGQAREADGLWATGYRLAGACDPERERPWRPLASPPTLHRVKQYAVVKAPHFQGGPSPPLFTPPFSKECQAPETGSHPLSCVLCSSQCLQAPTVLPSASCLLPPQLLELTEEVGRLNPDVA